MHALMLSVGVMFSSASSAWLALFSRQEECIFWKWYLRGFSAFFAMISLGLAGVIVWWLTR